MRVLLDPGHGGSQPGAIAQHQGRQLTEAVLNLQTATALRKLLVAHGHDVHMTRETDVTTLPGSRSKACRDYGPDLVVSLHYNACPNESASGPQVYFAKRGNGAERWATAIATKLEARLLSTTPTDWTKRANTVLSWFVKPSVLVECAFLTNAADRQAIVTGLPERIAEHIADAIGHAATGGKV